MIPPELQHASQVCSTCRARKKRCDKQLSGCGYCTKRRLACHYDISLPIRTTGNALQDPAAWRRQVPATATDRVAAPSINAFEIALSPQTTSLYYCLRSGKGMALSEVLFNQVSCLIESVGLSPPEISDRFFAGFHRWLPIISPQHFCAAITDFHAPGPKADISVLLLAMCLIILRPPSSALQRSAVCLKSLYMTVRFSFTQVQAVICASTPLIQAGILIAAYEYACQQLDMAFISIGACARMSGITGIDRDKTQWNNGQPNAESILGILEERNVWWGVIIMERWVHRFCFFPGECHSDVN